MHATSICLNAACSSGFAHKHAALRLPHIARWHLLCAAARTSADDLDPLYGDESTCPVPLAQQPAYQLEQLQQVPVFAWATRPVDQWLWQIGLVWLASAILLGLPISRSSFPHENQLAQCLFSSSIGGLLVVTGVVARLWLVRVCCYTAACKVQRRQALLCTSPTLSCMLQGVPIRLWTAFKCSCAL